MAYEHSGDEPVYAPNSMGRPYSDVVGPVEDGWETDGEMVRTAYALRPEDDDWTQPGRLVRDVWDDAQRDRFVQTVAGHLSAGVTGDVLERAFQYWKSVDEDTGKQIEALVTNGHGSGSPGTKADDAEAAAQRYLRDTKTSAKH